MHLLELTREERCVETYGFDVHRPREATRRVRGKGEPASSKGGVTNGRKGEPKPQVEAKRGEPATQRGAAE